MASNRIVHFEIPADQPGELTKFYGALFGWKFTQAPFDGPEYWLADTGSGQPGINGAVMQRMHPQHPWMNYVEVESIDAAIAKATELGAEVALPPNARPRRRCVRGDQRPAGQHLRPVGTGRAVAPCGRLTGSTRDRYRRFRRNR